MKTALNISKSFVLQIIFVFIQFVILYFVNNLTAANGRGEWAIYNNGIAFAGLLCSLSLGSAIVYFISSGKRSNQDIFTLLLVFSLPILLLAVFICSILIFLEKHNSIIPFIYHQNWTIIWVAHVFFSVWFQFCASIFNANNKFIEPIVFQIIHALFFLLFCLYLNLFPNSYINNEFLLKTYAISFCLMCLFFIVYTIIKFKLNFSAIKLNKEFAQSILAFGLMAYLCNLIQMLCYRMDIWLLNEFKISKSQIGIYSVAALIIQLMWLLPNIISSVLYTKFSEENNSINNKTQLVQSVSACFWISLLGYGFTALAASYLIPILLGKEYQIAKPVFIILIGAIPFSSAMILAADNASQKKLNINLWASLVGLALNLLFNIMLIKKYGIFGAAIASAICYFSTALILFFCSCRYYKISIVEFLKFPKPFIKDQLNNF